MKLIVIIEKAITSCGGELKIFQTICLLLVAEHWKSLLLILEICWMTLLRMKGRVTRNGDTSKLAILNLNL